MINFPKIYAGRDLKGADFSGQDLSSAILGGANLSNTNISSATLVEADLGQANLTGGNLAGADLRRADLRGANLDGAILKNADLRGAKFSGANLNNVEIDSNTLCDDELRYILRPAQKSNVIQAQFGSIEHQSIQSSPVIQPPKDTEHAEEATARIDEMRLELQKLSNQISEIIELLAQEKDQQIETA